MFQTRASLPSAGGGEGPPLIRFCLTWTEITDPAVYFHTDARPEPPHSWPGTLAALSPEQKNAAETHPGEGLPGGSRGAPSPRHLPPTPLPPPRPPASWDTQNSALSLPGGQ